MNATSDIVYTRNPAVSWARTDDTTYVVNLGSRLIQLAGPAAAFVFDEFMPKLDHPMTYREIVAGAWTRPVGDVERALSAACSISALLARANHGPIGVYDVLRLQLDLPEDEPSVTLRLDVVDPHERIAAVLDRAFDAPHTLRRYESVDQLLAARAPHESANDAAWPDRLAIVVDDADDTLALANANKALVARGVWWLPLRLAAAHAAVGPLVIPFQTACFECAVIRHASVSSEANLLHRLELDVNVPRYRARKAPVSAALVHQVAGIAASELLLYSAPPSMPGLISRIVTVSHVSMGARYHRVMRVPTCPSCGLSPVVPRHPWERLSVKVSEVVGHELDA